MFYLALTIPLTHLVNYIDARLRRGQTRGRLRRPGQPRQPGRDPGDGVTTPP